MRCYKCKITVNPADPDVIWDSDQEDYVHRDCVHLTEKIQKVKAHLLRGGRLTAADAVEYWRYHRLSSGIHKLNHQQMGIQSEICYDEKDKRKHWAVYFIPQNK